VIGTFIVPFHLTNFISRTCIGIKLNKKRSAAEEKCICVNDIASQVKGRSSKGKIRESLPIKRSPGLKRCQVLLVAED